MISLASLDRMLIHVRFSHIFLSCIYEMGKDQLYEKLYAETIAIYEGQNRSLFIDNEQNILLCAHIDKVGLIYTYSLSKKRHIYNVYGNISTPTYNSLKKIYNAKGTILHIKNITYISKKQVEIETEHVYKLMPGDRYYFLPEYDICEGRLRGPYLDNLIGYEVLKKIKKKYSGKVSFWHSIDEEVGLHGTSKDIITFGLTAPYVIIVDTIDQAYLEETMDYRNIYQVYKTARYKNTCIDHNKIRTINFDTFCIESDLIRGSRGTYHFLCPIQYMHTPHEQVLLESLDLLYTYIVELVGSITTQ